MIEDDSVYLTPEGLKQIEDELEHLKTVRRQEIAIKLETAIKQGDLKENADYHDAKEEQGFIEGRIRQLEDSLRRAKVIENRGPSNVVRVGSRVTVAEVGLDEEETYVIVGAHEADPANGRISNISPIGSALLGAKVGQTVAADTPAGIIEFRIIRIA
ncbi:MAG: transcription elongation factor GreA [Candidatus Promineofilum sp.]|nr:transcription elongation factor GreA [Promineifilum sp.]MCW5864334.1 transcription elongation factor GreA [Anaerolineae bacterium]